MLVPLAIAKEVGREKNFWIGLFLFLLSILQSTEANQQNDRSGETHTYDILIKGGMIIDGTGKARYPADIAIRGDRIILISKEAVDPAKALRTIDAQGKIVSPGFIDFHAHLDPLLRLPDCESHVRQGVTTALGGPDGSAPLPLKAYLDSVSTRGTGMNVAFLTGHNSIRARVMGMQDRDPTPDELRAMEFLVEEGMEQGAFGLSTGLKYLPGAFSKIDEIISLARVAALKGGIYTSHLREEGLGLIEGVAEAIEIGRRAAIPVILTHHKVIGKPMWGSSVRTLAMVDSARLAGVDVMIDQYPYTASYTGISVLVPSWAMAGGEKEFLRRLEKSAERNRIIDGIVENLLNDRGGGDLRRVQLARVPWKKELEGKTLHDWAVSQNLEPSLQTGAELVIEIERHGGASAIYHVIDERDVERIMRHPQTMIASDGRLVSPGEGHPHPRWYGTFPRILGHYVREKNILTLEEAISKMTGMPAKRLDLRDRGFLQEGLHADIVIFDSKTIRDRATYEHPHQYPEGIEYVFVNGVVAVDKGTFTKKRGGKVLRKTDR